MPYAMKKQGEKYCVVNSESGETKGCSDNKKTALAHMRKLYSVEGKSLDEVESLLLKAAYDFQTKDGEVVEPEDLSAEKSYYGETPYVPFGVTSYADLDAQREAWRKSREVEEQISLFPQLAYSIMSVPEITDKASAIEGLAAELAVRIREAANEDYKEDKASKTPAPTENIPASDMLLSKPVKFHKETEPAKGISKIAQEVVGYLKSVGVMKENGSESLDEGIMFFKDNENRSMWVARYSNNFIDNDDPPDIISEKSHRRFVKLVEKGVYPYPELWVWHEKSWDLGQAVWCAYDDSGFAMAAGYVRPECEPIAQQFAQLKSRALSHGMPISSIVRDPEDPRVIIEHQTTEISLLPEWGAANKLTSYDILGKDGMEDDMALPKEKKVELIKVWGVSEATLKSLEELNAKTAAKAADAGVEQKDAPDATPPDATEKTADTAVTPETKDTPQVEQPTAEKTGETSQDTPLSRQEIAEAFAPTLNALTEAVVKMKEQIDGLSQELTELKSVKEKSLAEQMFSKSPVASLMAMFGDSRAVGSPETEVKDGELSNKPKETPATEQELSPIPFINKMLLADKK